MVVVRHSQNPDLQTLSVIGRYVDMGKSHARWTA
jgi:hypothetical protein